MSYPKVGDLLTFLTLYTDSQPMVMDNLFLMVDYEPALDKFGRDRYILQNLLEEGTSLWTFIKAEFDDYGWRLL